MTVPRGFFQNRQSCHKHPKNAYFLRGFLWTPGSGVPEPSYEQPKTDWWLYVGPFSSPNEAGIHNFLLTRWAYQNGFVWWTDRTDTICVWGPDPANGLLWPASAGLQYTWVYEPNNQYRYAKYRKYQGLPGKYAYLWETPTSHKEPSYLTDGLPGWTGV